MLDYETLRILWWALLVFLVCGFAVMDGFDLGIGILLPFLGKTDDERRVMLNTVGPTWEGNQTWLVTLGGITFGAWSLVYATVFSGLYTGLLVLLLSLILRPVGFDYRSKLTDPRWRSVWDWALFVGGLVPAVVLSLAVGNVMQGLPFQLDAEMRSVYSGGFWGLFNPFALFCVIVGTALLTMHGAAFLQYRTEDQLAERAKCCIVWAGSLFLVSFLLAGVWVAYGLDGYRIDSVLNPAASNTPLAKTVSKTAGQWLYNYQHYPLLIFAPVITVGSVLLGIYCSLKNKAIWAFFATCLTVTATLLTAGGSMFPFIIPSSIDPASSLTVWDASASRYTLQLLFFATIVFMPIVMAYTAWVYRVMRGKVTVADIQNNQHILY
ncbi:cytochrome bd ubiquinol oxidase subunit II [biofilm metagenome]